MTPYTRHVPYLSVEKSRQCNNRLWRVSPRVEPLVTSKVPLEFRDFNMGLIGYIRRRIYVIDPFPRCWESFKVQKLPGYFRFFMAGHN